MGLKYMIMQIAGFRALIVMLASASCVSASTPSLRSSSAEAAVVRSLGLLGKEYKDYTSHQVIEDFQEKYQQLRFFLSENAVAAALAADLKESLRYFKDDVAAEDIEGWELLALQRQLLRIAFLHNQQDEVCSWMSEWGAHWKEDEDKACPFFNVGCADESEQHIALAVETHAHNFAQKNNKMMDIVIRRYSQMAVEAEEFNAKLGWNQLLYSAKFSRR